MTPVVFPYDRSALLTVENPDFLADLESFVGGLWRSDVSQGDWTTSLLENTERRVSAVVVAKEDGFFSGKLVVEWLFQRMKFRSSVQFKVKDGAGFKKGDVLLKLRGPAQEILRIERTLLNVLQRTCGITTQTRRYVDAAVPCRVAATRKTQWGLLDKYAVAVGGGLTHRLSLGEALLFKENHMKLMKHPEDFWMALFSALRPHVPFVTIEIETPQDAAYFWGGWYAPLRCPVFLMFDDFSPKDLQRTLKDFKRVRNLYFEASGGITLENIRAYAQTGVDVLSIGALTHSVPALDLSLLIGASVAP